MGISPTSGKAADTPPHFFKYMSRSTAEIVLKSSRLRWSRPASFNDPFDIQFDLHLEIDEQKLTKLALDKLWEAFFGSTPYHPAPHSRMGALITFARKNGFPIRDRAKFDAMMGPVIPQSLEDLEANLPWYHQQLRVIGETAKVLCQSEVGDSILMWSYYAEQHKGVVLRLKPVVELDSVWLAAEPVVYSAKMPRLFDEEFMSNMIAGKVLTNEAAVLRATVYTKALEWAHEKEWRLYAAGGWQPTQPFEDVPFKQQELDAVLLGCAMPTEDRKRIADLTHAYFPAAKVLQARKHDREFSLIIEEVLP